jgi:hypothetical protein
MALASLKYVAVTWDFSLTVKPSLTNPWHVSLIASIRALLTLVLGSPPTV